MFNLSDYWREDLNCMAMVSKDWLKEIRDEFGECLLSWYRDNHRSLPWRETPDPYYIWVSEVMLQQTQVKTVIDYYHRFIERFPSVTDLASSDVSNVIKLWEGLGYYSRVRNLHKAASVVVSEYGGVVPDDYAEFRKLPGVGAYIAAAVMSIAFDQPTAVVDGNVKRVLSRLLRMNDPVNQSSSLKKYQSVADTLLDRTHPGDYNQALMELGAVICAPRNASCVDCPVSLFCSANLNNTVGDFPVTIKKKKTPTYQITVGIIINGSKFLVTLRKPEGMLGGLWEFPGGKVKEKEPLEEACAREIREETGLNITVLEALPMVKHAYTHFKIRLTPFICSAETETVKLNGPVDYRWISWEEIQDYAFPGANHKIFPKLKEYLERRNQIRSR